MIIIPKKADPSHPKKQQLCLVLDYLLLNKSIDAADNGNKVTSYDLLPNITHLLPRLCNPKILFCYLMSQVLTGLDFCFGYLDDILIYSTSWKEHLQNLETVLNNLQVANLKIKVSKCHFFKQHLHHLGHLISEKGIQPLPGKIITIKIQQYIRTLMDIIIFLD